MIIKLLLVMLVSLSLTACTVVNSDNSAIQKNDTIEMENNEIDTLKNLVTLEKTSDMALTLEDEVVLYEFDETAALLKDGELFGTVTPNFCTRLGIWDWYNTTAVTLGIDYSYSLNMTVDVTPLLEEQETAVLTPAVTIYNNEGKALSSGCEVGWSGFDTKAELYKKTPSTVLETGIQPTSLVIDEGCYIGIIFSDSVSGKTFDQINFSYSLLENSIQGNTLKTFDERFEIKSINGATYEIVFNKVEHNDRYSETDGILSKIKTSVYDIKYGVTYINAPTNDVSVSVFDSFSNNRLTPKLTFSVVADIDGTKLTTVDDKLRTLFINEKNKNYTKKYITALKAQSVGDSFYYNTNRVIGTSVSPANDYVRIILEFPEEQAARTLAQMKEFNGRHLVFQIPLTEHVPEEGEVTDAR